MDFTQYYCMVQKQTILAAMGESYIPRYHYRGTAILDHGGIRKLWILQRFQHMAVSEVETVRSNVPVCTAAAQGTFTDVRSDPWWIFTTINLFWNIKYRYEFGYFEVVKISPRFGLMLSSMCLSVVFIIVDILAVTPALKIGGLNPFWKIAFVFKCFTDTIILDDFKTALDKLSEHKMRRLQNVPDLELQRPPRTTIDEEGLCIEEEPEGKPGVIHVEKRFCTVSIERTSITESAASTSSIVKHQE